MSLANNMQEQPLLEEPTVLLINLETAQDDDRPIYIAGNFNEWREEDPAFQFHKVGAGKYIYEFPKYMKLSYPIKYKYTKGDWRHVELDEYGNPIRNRIIEEATEEVEDLVPRWLNNGVSYNSALLPKKVLVDEDFGLPQLNRTRRIWALLPHDYDETDRHYPVIYLQDGQNLLEEHAPFGSWSIDKKLAVLAEQNKHEVIIIAIDHAGKERITEFAPFHTERFKRGDGRKYIRFMVDTLKPFIDKNYRTLPDREHTGVGGSSMGGLVSIYAGLISPEVFGRLLIFSPSLWMIPKIYFRAIDFSKPYDSRVYIYAGAKESETMIENIHRLRDVVKQKKQNDAKIHLRISIDEYGQHTEYFWGSYFPKAIDWLFFQGMTDK